MFDPVEFLGRLAVLVPRPRINLILYHGVLGPRAAWRRQVVRHAASVETQAPAATDATSGPAEAREEVRPSRAGGRLWADLMQRTFGLDVLTCPRCGGRLRLLALIEQTEVIERILRHLGLPTEIPDPCAARAPPLIEAGSLRRRPQRFRSLIMIGTRSGHAGGLPGPLSPADIRPVE